MSSSSENSLAELPLPYDISSAVSRALRVNSAGAMEELAYNPGSNQAAGRSARSLSYTTAYYDYPAHPHQHSGAYNVVGPGESENFATAAAAPPPPPPPPPPTYFNGQYFYGSIPNSTAATATAAAQAPDPPPYYYPHHYTASIYPTSPQVQMEVEAWTENSICNSSSDMLESQSNIEQLDQFCRYIDSSGDEELVGEGSSSSTMKADYERYSRGMRSAMIGSPPKRKRKNSYPVAMSSSYYCGGEEEEEEEEERREREEDTGDWKVVLENSSMWKEFDRVGTEMVITKAGR